MKYDTDTLESDPTCLHVYGLLHPFFSLNAAQEGLRKLALVAAQESKFASEYKAGWLVKRARKGKSNWRKRHVALAGEKLTYADVEGGRPKGQCAVCVVCCDQKPVSFPPPNKQSQWSQLFWGVQ